MGISLWQKDSLVTLILFEQNLGNSLYVNWIIASIFENVIILRMKRPSSSLYLSRHSIFCNFFMILIFSGFCVLQHMNSRVINWKIGLQQLPSVVNLVLKFPVFQFNLYDLNLHHYDLLLNTNLSQIQTADLKTMNEDFAIQLSKLLETLIALQPQNNNNCLSKLNTSQCHNEAIFFLLQGCSKGQKSRGAGSNAARRHCPAAPSDLPKSGGAAAPPAPPAPPLVARLF